MERDWSYKGQKIDIHHKLTSTGLSLKRKSIADKLNLEDERASKMTYISPKLPT